VQKLFVKVRKQLLDILELLLKEQKLLRDIRNLFAKKQKLFKKVRKQLSDIPDLLPKEQKLFPDIRNLFAKKQKLFRKVQKQLLDIPELFPKEQKLFLDIQKLVLKLPHFTALKKYFNRKEAGRVERGKSGRKYRCNRSAQRRLHAGWHSFSAGIFLKHLVQGFTELTEEEQPALSGVNVLPDVNHDAAIQPACQAVEKIIHVAP
jgi:hypothetical protein